MGCFFGCCNKPSRPIIKVDESSEGLRIQGRTVTKYSSSEGFWSSGTSQMDNSVVQSISLSAISTSNQPHDPSSVSGSTSNPSEFVNHDLILWNQMRQQWIANKRSQDRTQVREPTISWNASYENLLGTNKRFAQPIHLPEMVNFVVEIWEQAGLYD